MSIQDRYLQHVASDIDRLGMAAVACDVDLIVEHADRAGLTGAALAVLRDPAETEVARARAFGIVATQLWLSGRVPAATSHEVALAV